MGNLSVLLAFIDTYDLIGGETWDHSGRTDIADKPQLSWLTSTLNAATNFDYKIVVGHYPIISVRANTNDLVQNLLPLFLKLGVDLYIHG